MRKYRQRSTALLVGFTLLLAGSTSPAVAAIPATDMTASNQSTARVWFLRPTSSTNDTVWGASPTIFANGAPIAPIPPNSAFYQDFSPGTYSFAVQPYGMPTGDADVVHLSPGSQTYLNVEWVPTWQMGYPSSGRGSQSHSFFVLDMSPQLAQAYLPSLNDLGRR